ncbi:Uncharacterized protein C8035_v005263 [Colletotrichum spinosum]|uniref:Uncharacterized protein n=1 Tax=Colletotrichum spinosum TaxID=1347390 RepID=A0A4R8PYZ0_9PEZI|nr:Uncharacterized protein C8035_v005263 [Colletotrichum spinosum]
MPAFALRLATPAAGVRVAAASSPTFQLPPPYASVTAAKQPPSALIVPSQAVVSVVAAAAASATASSQGSMPPKVLARVLSKETELPKRYFKPSNSSHSDRGGKPGKKSGDDNKADLGNTLRILQDRLPTILQSPLPQEILAPNISLHLFPTTHPHLPTVSGKVAYTAALWSAPIAWNQLPLVGNVRLSIISERVTKQPLTFAPREPGALPEQLVVRWCTPGERNGSGGPSPTTAGTAAGKRGEGGFTGIFVFHFDSQGRILSHTIETVQTSGDWERGVGAKVVGLTDWLLGGLRRGPENPMPTFSFGIKRP